MQMFPVFGRALVLVFVRKMNEFIVYVLGLLKAKQRPYWQLCPVLYFSKVPPHPNGVRYGNALRFTTSFRRCAAICRPMWQRLQGTDWSSQDPEALG
jgi:hypothetical protein